MAKQVYFIQYTPLRIDTPLGAISQLIWGVGEVGDRNRLQVTRYSFLDRRHIIKPMTFRVNLEVWE